MIHHVGQRHVDAITRGPVAHLDDTIRELIMRRGSTGVIRREAVKRGMQGLTGAKDPLIRGTLSYRFIGGSNDKKGLLAVFENPQLVGGEGQKDAKANCMGPLVWWGIADRDAAKSLVEASPLVRPSALAHDGLEVVEGVERIRGPPTQAERAQDEAGGGREHR